MPEVRLLSGKRVQAPTSVSSVASLLHWLTQRHDYRLTPSFLTSLWITRNSRPLDSFHAAIQPDDCIALHLRLRGGGKLYFYYSAMNAGTPFHFLSELQVRKNNNALTVFIQLQ